EAGGCGASTGMVERADQRTRLNHLQVSADTLQPEAVRPDTVFGERTERASIATAPITDNRTLPSAYQDSPVQGTTQIINCTYGSWSDPACYDMYDAGNGGNNPPGDGP